MPKLTVKINGTTKFTAHYDKIVFTSTPKAFYSTWLTRLLRVVGVRMKGTL